MEYELICDSAKKLLYNMTIKFKQIIRKFVDGNYRNFKGKELL